MDPKTRNFQVANSKSLAILACTVFDYFTRVTDGRTDRETNIQNCDGYDALQQNLLSRVKIVA